MDKIEVNSRHPSLILAIYQSDSRSAETYVERHRVLKSGEILEGQAVTRAQLASLSRAMSLQASESDNFYFDWIPDQLKILRAHPDGLRLGWVVPRRKSPMYFAADLEINDGQVWHPDMFFFWDGRALRVYWIDPACNGNVTPDTKLFLAPYHNLSGDGLVCMGDAVIKPDANLSVFMRNVEAAFFLSKFSHSYESLCKKLHFNINSYWRNKIDKKFSIKKSDYIALDKTIGDLS